MGRTIQDFITCLQCLFGVLLVTDVASYMNIVRPTIPPQFDKSVSSNLTVITENTAQLNCRIWNLGNQTVVWVRHRDIHLLTVNQLTYTSDERFNSLHDPDTDVWSLQIKNVRLRDSGIYECQVGTTPAIGIPIYLSVVQPITTVLGGPDLFINAGSTINLTCIVQNLPVPPSYVVWTHNNEDLIRKRVDAKYGSENAISKEVNFDSPRGGVSVITEKGDVTTSYLYIQRAGHLDTGEYKCSPSNANNVTVKVHILKGEQSAAIQQISNGQHTIYHKLNVIILMSFGFIWLSHRT